MIVHPDLALRPEDLAAAAPDPIWPRKQSIFGVKVSVTDYAAAIEAVFRAIRAGQPGIVDLMPVHGLITAVRNADFREMANAFDMVGPDGQPVRWALNALHNAGLSDRVYGPELTLRLCAAAEKQAVPIYLYGGSSGVLEDLQAALVRRYPGLIIAGAESPPYRPLTPEEDAAAVARINASGASMVFIGLGCPKQEAFAYEHRNSIHAIQFCVGAAFDFHAGAKRTAPLWMQRHGLEWLFRLCQEPGRLWKRYLVTNSLFLGFFSLALARHYLSQTAGRSPTANARFL